MIWKAKEFKNETAKKDKREKSKWSFFGIIIFVL